MTVISLAPSFIRTVTTLHGQAAMDWFARFPGLIKDIQRRFGVRVTGQPGRYSRHVILWAETISDAVPVVIKCAPPIAGLRAEAQALAAFGGETSARLLDHWPEAEALLIERLVPGEPLNMLEDDREVLRIAACVMPGLWRPVPSEPAGERVADLARVFTEVRQRFPNGVASLDPSLLAAAEATFARLTAGSAGEFLIHGDMHSNAILSAQRRPWLAFDPKGLIGEREFDAAILIAEPSPRVTRAARPMQVIAERLTLLPDLLGLERGRCADYAFCYAMIIACTLLRDFGRGNEMLHRMAQAIAKLRRDDTK